MNLILEAIFTLVLAIGNFLFVRYAKPWLEQNNLMTAAQIAVNAAQAAYSRYNGDKKLEYALSHLKSLGFNIEAQDVLDAVNAAWQKLNMTQIAAGIKEV